MGKKDQGEKCVSGTTTALKTTYFFPYPDIKDKDLDVLRLSEGERQIIIEDMPERPARPIK